MKISNKKECLAKTQALQFFYWYLVLCKHFVLILEYTSLYITNFAQDFITRKMKRLLDSLSNANKLAAIIMLSVAIGLFVVGFIVPPVGSIDGSVLTAGGILVAGVAIMFAWDRSEAGADTQFKHGNTELNIKAK